MRIVLALLIACGSSEERAVPRDPNFRATHTGSLDSTLPFGSELTISAGDDITEALRRTVEMAMRPALAEAMTCMAGIYGTAPLEVELHASGKVTKAKIVRGLLEGTPIAECIEKAFVEMQIDPSRARRSGSATPVRNMPSAEQVRDTADMLKGALKLTIG